MKPAQLSIGDLVTDDIVGRMYSIDKKRQQKREGRPDAEQEFADQARTYGLPAYTRKVKFLSTHLTPKLKKQAFWEADGVFEQYKLIIEVQGGVWRRGGGAHSHPIDITRNFKKQNDFVLLGYQVLQFTPEEVLHKDKTALAYTMRVLSAKGWQP